MQKEVKTVDLEQMMRVFQDTKKEMHFNKFTGKWSWSDRGEETLYGECDWFLEMVQDAVEPYMQSDLEV